MINTTKFCAKAADVYGLDTSKVPEYIETYDDVITVGCVLHGDYGVKAKTVVNRKSYASPGCPDCLKVKQERKKHFQEARKVRQRYGI